MLKIWFSTFLVLHRIWLLQVVLKLKKSFLWKHDKNCCHRLQPFHFCAEIKNCMYNGNNLFAGTTFKLCQWQPPNVPGGAVRSAVFVCQQPGPTGQVQPGQCQTPWYLSAHWLALSLSGCHLQHPWCSLYTDLGPKRSDTNYRQF